VTELDIPRIDLLRWDFFGGNTMNARMNDSRGITMNEVLH
jgi:hypothetical protein